MNVSIISTTTSQVKALAKDILALGINTVDSYDIHQTIWDLRQSLDPVAKDNKAVSVISAGWDPGSDSMVRALVKAAAPKGDRKSTRLNSSHVAISYAVFCLKKKSNE